VYSNFKFAAVIGLDSVQEARVEPRDKVRFPQRCHTCLYSSDLSSFTSVTVRGEKKIDTVLTNLPRGSLIDK